MSFIRVQNNVSYSFSYRFFFIVHLISSLPDLSVAAVILLSSSLHLFLLLFSLCPCLKVWLKACYLSKRHWFRYQFLVCVTHYSVGFKVLALSVDILNRVMTKIFVMVTKTSLLGLLCNVCNIYSQQQGLPCSTIAGVADNCVVCCEIPEIKQNLYFHRPSFFVLAFIVCVFFPFPF